MNNSTKDGKEENRKEGEGEGREDSVEEVRDEEKNDERNVGMDKNHGRAGRQSCQFKVHSIVNLTPILQAQ